MFLTYEQNHMPSDRCAVIPIKDLQCEYLVHTHINNKAKHGKMLAFLECG